MASSVHRVVGRPWLRAEAAGLRVCSLVAVSRALQGDGTEPPVRTGERLAQLVVFGLWCDAAYLPDGTPLAPEQWTRLVPLDLDRLRTRLGFTTPEVAHGLDLAVRAGLIVRRPRLDEVQLTECCFADHDGVTHAVAWPRVVAQLVGAGAALAAMRGATHLLETANAPGRLPIDALAKVTGYSPNAIRDGLSLAVERGLLAPDIVAGPRRTYRLTDYALGRDVAPVLASIPPTSSMLGGAPAADPAVLTAVEVAGVPLRIPSGVDVTVRVEGMDKAVTIRVG